MLGHVMLRNVVWLIAVLRNFTLLGVTLVNGVLHSGALNVALLNNVTLPHFTARMWGGVCLASGRVLAFVVISASSHMLPRLLRAFSARTTKLVLTILSKSFQQLSFDGICQAYWICMSVIAMVVYDSCSSSVLGLLRTFWTILVGTCCFLPSRPRLG